MRRKRDGKKYSLDLPTGMTCGRCKNYEDCSLKGHAIAGDEQCDFLPLNFALSGEESKAEEHTREHHQILEEGWMPCLKP
jgi:hypothetical protein